MKLWSETLLPPATTSVEFNRVEKTTHNSVGELVKFKLNTFVDDSNCLRQDM